VNFGNGDGTFDTRLQIVPTNAEPAQVSAVDLNGDNKLELVGLNSQTQSIDVWEHAAVTGSSRLLSSFVVGPSVESFGAGDFNGDGLVDLAVTTHTNSFNPRGSNQVVILTNRGNYTFQDAGHYPLDFRPNEVVAGDFNGDGDLDLAVHVGGGSLNGGSQLVSMLGDGAAGFQVGAPVVVGIVISFMAPADAEGDLRSELVLRGSRLVGSVFQDFLEIFAVDASGGWTNHQSLAFTNRPGSIQLASINGDAHPDLVLLENDDVSSKTSFRMYPGSPAGFGAEQILADEVEFQSFSRIADLNDDGLLDAVSFDTLYLAKPAGGFYPGQPIWIGTQGVQEVEDFNRDGQPDLMSGLSILLQE
jgi:hypothetical protein